MKRFGAVAELRRADGCISGKGLAGLGISHAHSERKGHDDNGSGHFSGHDDKNSKEPS